MFIDFYTSSFKRNQLQNINMSNKINFTRLIKGEKEILNSHKQK